MLGYGGSNYASIYDELYGGNPLSQPRSLPVTDDISFYVEDYPSVDIVSPVFPPSRMPCIPGVDTNKIDVVQPESFGAMGDGITDDREAIQLAIDYLSSDGAGGIVELSSKTYILGHSGETDPTGDDYGVGLESNVTLRGLGDCSVIKAAELDSEPGYILITGCDIDNAAVRNLRMENIVENITNGKSVFAVHLKDCSHCEIADSSFNDFGYLASGSGSGSVLACKVIEGSGQSYANRIINNSIYDNNQYAGFAIRIKSNWETQKEWDEYTNMNMHNIVRGNYIEGIAWNAIEIAGPATRQNQIIGNVVHDTHAIRAIESDKGASDNIFMRNIVDLMNIPVAQSDTYAAFCDQGDSGEVGGVETYPVREARNNQWIGNSAHNIQQGEKNHGTYGFYCNRSRGLIINELSISNIHPAEGSDKLETVAGVYVQRDFNNVEISGCCIQDAPISIFIADGDMENIGIMGCSLLGDYYGIKIIGSADKGNVKDRFSIVGNSVKSAISSGGLAVHLSGIKHAEMTGNTIVGNRVQQGTSVQAEKGTLVEYGKTIFSGCVIQDAQDGALQIVTGSAAITGNMIGYPATGTVGIYLRDDAANCVISGNTLLRSGTGDIPRIVDLGSNNIMSTNMGASSLAKQEACATSTSISIDPNTETMLLSSTGTVESVDKAVAGRRLAVIASAQVTLSAETGSVANEFHFYNDADVVLAAGQTVVLESIDVGSGVIMWTKLG